ncbi:MAG: NUDIX hydrolase [bacterium]|nr:NUDIX hydrolase [bacterium]
MEIQRPRSNQEMPPHAKRVFKGIVFDVYQWEQELFDGSLQTFEKLKRPDTVMIIPVLDNGKILVANQEQPGKVPFIGLLGGRVDEGEDVFRAAERELKEESGYEATEWELFDAVQPVSKIDWVVYTLIAKNCKRTAQQSLEAGEKIDVKEVTFDEFIDIVFSRKFVDIELKLRLLDARSHPEKMRAMREFILGNARQ